MSVTKTKTRQRTARRGVMLDPQIPEIAIGDNYTVHVSQATAYRPLQDRVDRRNLSGKIEVASEQRDVCFLSLEWEGAPKRGGGTEYSASIEDIPIALLDHLAVLIPALVAQAKRDGITPAEQ